jgi:hypothetical protein
MSRSKRPASPEAETPPPQRARTGIVRTRPTLSVTWGRRWPPTGSRCSRPGARRRITIARGRDIPRLTGRCRGSPRRGRRSERPDDPAHNRCKPASRTAGRRTTRRWPPSTGACGAARLRQERSRDTHHPQYDEANRDRFGQIMSQHLAVRFHCATPRSRTFRNKKQEPPPFL